MFLKPLDSAGEKHGSQRKSTESSQELCREVDLWIEFLAVSGMAPQGYELDKSPAPNTVLIKVFIWWGFATATGSAIAAKDRSKIYRWIRFDLYGHGT
ncbi:uncharacterized protein N7484_006564 [Penicillium longicatenatum]|uniref:uncharacterized protein n=1 Tax=Penicillium longicatenatum TaxID=1561947 RepID=UPI002548FBC7|nr:uncharacterized protein N7484_006564 [Penicillium longicatenatum]KAJ5644057.1 hypothetical protein N7484_006564 [Penicillium longicatenatum]